MSGGAEERRRRVSCEFIQCCLLLGRKAGALGRGTDGESLGLPLRRGHRDHALDVRKINKGTGM